MHSLFYRWRVYDLDEQLIRKNSLNIRKSNLQTLKFVSLLVSSLMLLGSLFPFFIQKTTTIAIYYICTSFVSSLYFIFSTVLLRKPEYITKKIPYPALLISFFAFIYSYGILTSILTAKEYPAVLFHIIFLSSQLLLSLAALTNLVISLAGYIVFSLVSIYFKDQSIWVYDITNAFLTLVASAFIGWHVGRTKYRQIIDSSELSIANEKLYENSIRDLLTGLYNRGKFYEEFEDYRKRCQNGDVCLFISIIDIDYFKDYNDTFGHIAGDNVLKQIASVMTDYSSTRDVLFCRWGGEEFICAGAIKNESEGILRINELLHLIEDQKIETANKTVSEYVTASAGISIVPAGAIVNWMNEYNASDNALYKAKNSGRNRSFFS